MHMWTLVQALDRGQRMGSTHHLKADLPANFSADYLTQACFTAVLCCFAVYFFTALIVSPSRRDLCRLPRKGIVRRFFFHARFCFPRFFLLKSSSAGLRPDLSFLGPVWLCLLLMLTDLCVFYFFGNIICRMGGS